MAVVLVFVLVIVLVFVLVLVPVLVFVPVLVLVFEIMPVFEFVLELCAVDGAIPTLELESKLLSAAVAALAAFKSGGEDADEKARVGAVRVALSAAKRRR